MLDKQWNCVRWRLRPGIQDSEPLHEPNITNCQLSATRDAEFIAVVHWYGGEAFPDEFD